MQGYNDLTQSFARVEWPGLEAFLVSGSDAMDWLQGQVTNDVRLLMHRNWVDACLARATGQIEADVRLIASDEGVVVLTTNGAAVRDRVESMVILEDVALESLGRVTSIQGPGAGLGPLVAGLGGWRSPRIGTDGWETVGESPDVPVADWDAVNLATLEAGLALVGFDSDEKTLPPELGPMFDSTHVAYDKGCYVGQEVLQRIHSRGHTNKQWSVFLSDSPVHAGDLVTRDGVEVGKLTRSAVRLDGTWIFGAFVRNQALESGDPLFVGSSVVRPARS